jgi:hypothetical protein
MDPKACLEAAIAEFKKQFSGDEDYTHVEEHLQHYAEWRYRGGFNPMMDDGRTGDQTHERLINALDRL